MRKRFQKYSWQEFPKDCHCHGSTDVTRNPFHLLVAERICIARVAFLLFQYPHS